jgi:hypothetical protein
VFDFLSHHALMMLNWADRAESTIKGWPGPEPADRETAALATIESTLAKYPATPHEVGPG